VLEERGPGERKREEGGETRTVRDWLQRSAAMLVLARAFRASRPALAFARISSEPGFVGFSRTKKARERMAKKVVYMVNQ